jgi:hypothetical protein
MQARLPSHGSSCEISIAWGRCSSHQCLARLEDPAYSDTPSPSLSSQPYGVCAFYLIRAPWPRGGNPKTETLIQVSSGSLEEPDVARIRQALRAACRRGQVVTSASAVLRPYRPSERLAVCWWRSTWRAPARPDLPSARPAGRAAPHQRTVRPWPGTESATIAPHPEAIRCSESHLGCALRHRPGRSWVE